MTHGGALAAPAPTSRSLRAGGVCAIVGAVVFATVRVLHGDTPAADAQAALDFVASRPGYPAVHVFAVFAALTELTGLVVLAGSLVRPSAWLLGRMGVISAVVGLGIFGVESTSEGLALPELAAAASGAAPAEHAELVRAARAVAAATHGPSLVAIALLFGVAVVLVGAAMVLDAYPSWLGWAGIVVGGVTLGAATGLYLRPALLDGALLYGVLASVLVQLWVAAVGVVLLSAARSGAG
jgi:hypothetical protein